MVRCATDKFGHLITIRTTTHRRSTGIQRPGWCISPPWPFLCVQDVLLIAHNRRATMVANLPR
jgi:hypothetical protein